LLVLDGHEYHVTPMKITNTQIWDKHGHITFGFNPCTLNLICFKPFKIVFKIKKNGTMFNYNKLDKNNLGKLVNKTLNQTLTK
jgi:hypothetical protein